MAKSDKRKSGKKGSTKSSATSQDKKSRMQTIRENKALFSVLFLIAIIILAAISIGIYYAASTLTENTPDEQANVSSTQQDNDSQDTNDTSEEEEENEATETEEPTEEDSNQDSETESENDSPEQTNGEVLSEQSNESSNEDESNDSNGSVTTTDQNGSSDTAVSGQIQTDRWSATDYRSGDITTPEYTVSNGDTLWEISEAYYGNGAQWTQILNANASSISYLPSGEQALIIPGQVLNLP